MNERAADSAPAAGRIAANRLMSLIGIDIGDGIIGGIVQMIVATIVSLNSVSFLKGVPVAGFVGALVAAIATSAVYWLIGWVISLIG